MTEMQWKECVDPRLMLDFLRGTASSRKLRLFICACCRLKWDQFQERSRSAVETAELVADGLANEADRIAAFWRAHHAGLRAHRSNSHIMCLAYFAAGQDDEMWPLAYNSVVGFRDRTRIKQCELLRDLFGNPCCPATLDPALMNWHVGTVVQIAKAIYEEARFQDLPVLADALEEAGCTNRDILGHCREPGEHVRGCWVVDLVLGKK